MSGVASKLNRLQRTTSVSLTSLQKPFLKPETKSCSLRCLHGSILHPRAPKIRHLNASHSLLVDMDKHIANVEALERKVLELEILIEERQQQKQIFNRLEPLTNIPDNRWKDCLVTEEDRIAFQNRLVEAKKRADELSMKTSREEANILRSWHSKRLKEVLQDLNSPLKAVKSLKLLAAPSQVEEDENRIFLSLNAMVDIVHSPDTAHIHQMQNLVRDREALKQLMEVTRLKLTKARRMYAECGVSLSNLADSSTALRLELRSSEQYLHSLMSSMWIYGPNPIFGGRQRDHTEVQVSFQIQFIREMLVRMDMSGLQADTNLALASSLITKYQRRLNRCNKRYKATETAIESQIDALNIHGKMDVDLEDGERMLLTTSETEKTEAGGCLEKARFEATTPDVPTRMGD